MVQRKVVNNKKHGIEGVTLITDHKKQAITKPSIHNHDGKSKGADLKAVKMKKSRPVVKRSNVDEIIISHHSIPMKTQLVTPMKTPSPKKLLACKSPNYMKSTSSSEARKDKRSITLSKESSNTNTNSNSNSNSISNKVGKTVNKLCNLKKMIGLTNSPSFKHKRSGGCKTNKVVICDIDVQRATCSSTLKDCKFPTYLKLKAGESEGAIGISSVCPYTYCSLNGHHHVSAPPLKRFLSSRRRLLKTRSQVTSPRPRKGAIEEEEEGDSEVQVYVPAIDREGGLGGKVGCDEILVSSDENIDNDLGDDQTEDSTLAVVMNYPLQTQASFESQSSPSGDNSYSHSDMEWEEGRSPTPPKYEDYYVHVETEYSKKIACFHQDIVEFLSFSDIDSLPSDNESTHSDDKHTDEVYMVTNLNLNGMSSEPTNEYIHLSNEATAYTAKLDDESFMKEIIDDGDELSERDVSQEAQEDASEFTFVMEERESIADYSDVIEKAREFNPREPNFLTIKPDPETEKVDLRHQQMDERRNADEWMLDYALQKTVTQLAPARNSKVALLVQAFESVLPPIPK